MRKLIIAVAMLAAAFTVLSGVAVAGKHGTSARAGDPDRDGVDTRNERRQGTDSRVRDTDRDGRSDGREDTDGDGLSNAVEDATGNDPVRRDSDRDGSPDGREGAGFVTAWADGTLTIKRTSGGTVTAPVDEFTEVTCPAEAAYERAQGPATKGLRKGAKARKRSGGSKRRGAGARAAQAPDEDAEDETGDDEDWGDGTDDGEWTDDEGDAGDDGSGDDADDEDWSDEDDWGADESPSACIGRIKRGMPVHTSAVDSGEEGSWFVEVALVR